MTTNPGSEMKARVRRAWVRRTLQGLIPKRSRYSTGNYVVVDGDTITLTHRVKEVRPEGGGVRVIPFDGTFLWLSGGNLAPLVIGEAFRRGLLRNAIEKAPDLHANSRCAPISQAFGPTPAYEDYRPHGYWSTGSTGPVP